MLLSVMAIPTQSQAATVTIQPTDTLTVNNCFPFGAGGPYAGPGSGWDPIAGFVYQNVPAFNLNVGDTLAFDLGALNDVNIELDIAMAATTTNGGNVEDAAGFTTVVTNTQLPANPRGNAVVGDFELRFIAEAPFSFAGGGLIIRFSNSSVAYAADPTCSAVLVHASPADVSGNFVERFFRDADGVSPWDDGDLDSIGGFQIINGVVLQPDGAAGKDAWLTNTGPDVNHGNHIDLTRNSTIDHGLIEFDLAAIPAGFVVNQASMEIWEHLNCDFNINALEVYANLDVWDEATVTWNNAPAYGAAPLATSTGEAAGPACEWVKFDVTAQVQDWVDGVSPNNGFRITGPAAGGGIKIIRSSDWTTASERPILRLDLSPPSTPGFLPDLSDGCGWLIPIGKQSLWVLAILPLMITGIVLARRRT